MKISIQRSKSNATVLRQKRALTANSAPLFTDQLPNELGFEELVCQFAGNFRERIFTPSLTLNLFLRQVLSADRSCQQAVLESSLARSSVPSLRHSSNTAAYCKSRKRLPLELVKTMTTRMGKYLDEKNKYEWKWFGRSVKLIDATTVSMPDTKANQNQFPQNVAQKEGLGFPLARVSAIISLANGAVLNAEIGDYYTSEHALFLKLKDCLSIGDVLVGDTLYGCYFIIAILHLMGIDCVFKAPKSRKYNFNRGKKFARNDHLASWYKPQRPAWISKELYSQLPEKIVMREIKNDDLIFVTTLKEHKKYRKKEIVDLYFKRWNIELDIRAIKNIMQMDILRCKTPQQIIKEIWVHLLAYNFVRLMLLNTSIIFDYKPRELSFKAALQGTRTLLLINVYIDKAMRLTIYQQLLVDISCHPVGNRSGRREPRVVKRRPKPLALMTKPRHLLKRKSKSAIA